MIMLVLFASLGSAQPQLVSVVNWPGKMGGLSGIELDDTGTRLTVLSDRGALQQGRIRRENGRITAIELAPPVRLRDGQGQSLRGKRADAEGLALAPGGNFHVSFEIHTRVVAYRPSGQLIRELPRPPAFKALKTNRSLEALANGPGGSLIAIPEARGRKAPVYQFLDGAWRVLFHLPLSEGFTPVGADFGPDGQLYVLERAISLLGFVSRVRRMAPDGSGLMTVLKTGLGYHGNLEGIAVWHDGGAVRLTMVTDDNLSNLQRNQLVEYRLIE